MSSPVQVGRVDVAILGAGISGVLSAQQAIKDGLSFRIFDRCTDFGGVWDFRANSYSHLQAHAAAYQWDEKYALARNPFKKVRSDVVLDKIRNCASDLNLSKHTTFGVEVTLVQAASAGIGYTVHYRDISSGQNNQLTADAIMCCTGILGEQLPGSDRDIRGIDNFKGPVSLAGKDKGQDCFLGRRPADAKDKHVVILGTGAFGLEALEAADRAGAKSITMISRERDRWIVPYAKQFKFICYSHIPFMPRSFRCWLTNRWLKSVYKMAGIQNMSPQPGSAHNFTGQCNDAFFRLAKQGRVRYVIGKVDTVQANSVKMAVTGEEIPADILIVGLGCKVLYQIPYLKELQLDVRQDLHNFAFLGTSGRIGLACDWVWFNVPHGPQKQIRSFFSIQKLLKMGKKKAVRGALHPTPFNGCKGESMKVVNPSGLKVTFQGWIDHAVSIKD